VTWKCNALNSEFARCCQDGGADATNVNPIWTLAINFCVPLPLPRRGRDPKGDPRQITSSRKQDKFRKRLDEEEHQGLVEIW